MSAGAGVPGSEWQQIDHKLADLMLSEVSEDMGKGIREAEQKIQFENRLNHNTFTIPSLRLQMQLERTDEWAQRTYDVYCDVWRRQGNSLTPQFLRSICANGIRTLISARTGSVTADLGLEAMRTNRYPSEWLRAATGEFRRSMERLFTKWVRRAEIDARTLEHVQPIVCDNAASASAAKEVEQARERIRHFEAKLAAIDTKIAAWQQSLTTAIVQGTSVIKAKDIDKAINRLHAERKEAEIKRDDWMLMASTALRRSEELANREIPLQLRTTLDRLEPRTTEQPIDQEAVILPAWGEFHAKFKALAEEEVRDDPGNMKDRWLRAYITIGAEGEHCQLTQGVNEGFKARFEALATRGGLALGGRENTEALESWLHSLFHHLLEHKSSELFAADQETGGIITRVCEASATYCARLERTALDQHGTLPSDCVRDRLQSDSGGTPGPKMKERSKLNYRSGIKRAISHQLVKEPRASALEVCRGLDADGAIDLPARWTLNSNRLFAAAYKNPAIRRKIEIAVSKVRTEMSNKGLFD